MNIDKNRQVTKTFYDVYGEPIKEIGVEFESDEEERGHRITTFDLGVPPVRTIAGLFRKLRAEIRQHPRREAFDSWAMCARGQMKMLEDYLKKNKKGRQGRGLSRRIPFRTRRFNRTHAFRD